MLGKLEGEAVLLVSYPLRDSPPCLSSPPVAHTAPGECPPLPQVRGMSRASRHKGPSIGLTKLSAPRLLLN